METIEAFKRRAGIVTDRRLPTESDDLGWLCLMQHFRSPTRLLDWSENLLVALYFAVSEDMDQAGEVWAMLPWGLNQKAMGRWCIPLTTSRHLKYLLIQPHWHGTAQALAKHVDCPEPMRLPLAIQPPMMFPRMAVQSSTFTIHPPPEGTSTIQEVLPESKPLVRYIVPAESKATLLSALRVLGFSHGHLFPDLEGLSQMIAFDNRELTYSPPEPPPCSGEAITEAADEGNAAMAL